MKFGLMFVNVGPFVQPDNLAYLAQSAEAAGVESVWTVEHVVVPVGYTAEYPYSPNGRMPGPENSPLPDPVLPLSFLAGVTEKIKLATGILILPQRHPTYVAKEFATLDNLSKGRAILGVGIGWLHEEFAAVGVPFEERVGRTEESIRAIRSLWSEKPEAFDGKYYSWPEVESNPKPVQPGGVPIVVGGHVKGAARRAARLGDGFFPARGNPEELIGVLREECDRIGRDPGEIEISFGAPPNDLDAIKRLQDLGVSRVVVPPPGFDRDSIDKGLEVLQKAIAELG
jgi:probable F420-dependent oxidoreductase